MNKGLQGVMGKFSFLMDEGATQARKFIVGHSLRQILNPN